VQLRPAVRELLWNICKARVHLVLSVSVQTTGKCCASHFVERKWLGQ
jgi:hypothetical protein